VSSLVDTVDSRVVAPAVTLSLAGSSLADTADSRVVVPAVILSLVAATDSHPEAAPSLVAHS
jgi:hypothetical protein